MLLGLNGVGAALSAEGRIGMRLVLTWADPMLDMNLRDTCIDRTFGHQVFF